MRRKYSNESNHDLVCGMGLSAYDNLPALQYKGRSFLFCSEGCRLRFKADPDRFHGEPLIQMRSIKKSFEKGGVVTKVLRGVDINIWSGDFVAIIGASGSGKSTLLNILGLLDRPTSGGMTLGGSDVSDFSDEERAEKRSHTFGFVFQQYNLIPWLSAYENAALPLLFAGKKVNKDNLEDEFKKIGLADRMTHRPFELSGGEQQRTALLRALSNHPDIILGDEPTGNLDSKTGEKILQMLLRLNSEQKKTLIIVTHDADIAHRADQVITLKDGNVLRGHQGNEKTYTE